MHEIGNFDDRYPEARLDDDKTIFKRMVGICSHQLFSRTFFVYFLQEV